MRKETPQEVAQNCLYQAIAKACAALCRNLDEAARQKLCRIILEEKGFPTKRFGELPELLESIGALKIVWGGETVAVGKGDSVLYIRPALFGPPEPERYHAVFLHNTTDPELLQAMDIILLICFPNEQES